jgi:cytochrome c peroxidase
MRTLALTLGLAACDTAPPPPPVEPVAAAPAIDAQLDAFFDPLPANMGTADRPTEAARVALGRTLYHDTRLSKNQDISCNSCHLLENWGVDGKPTSPGHRGQLGGRNSPTVYNAALHTAQFWDGRADDVEAQAKGPVLNPIEMAMPSEAAVVSVLKSIPGYEGPFQASFPGQADPITYDNMAIAIGAFERTLVSPGKWDRYLAGDASALTEAEVAGGKLFAQTGCVTCHMGVAVGGSSYQKLGNVLPYPTADEGRKVVTGLDADLHVFKVPSLRNVAKTAPYFHDGSVATLPEAVRLMAKHQLGKELTPEDTASIVTFLDALTGELPSRDVIAKPEIPPSGPNTPKADPT